VGVVIFSIRQQYYSHIDAKLDDELCQPDAFSGL
jgi:hypothetical protein